MKSESTRTSFWLARDGDSCLSENGNNGKSVFIKDLTHPDQQTTFCWPALVIFCPELLDQLNRPSVAYPASCHQLTDNNANIKWVNVSFGLASRLTRNCSWCWCCCCWPIQNQRVVIKFLLDVVKEETWTWSFSSSLLLLPVWWDTNFNSYHSMPAAFSCCLCWHGP